MMFWKLFDIAVDVATDTINTTAKVTDAVLWTELNEVVEEGKDIIKNKD